MAISGQLAGVLVRESSTTVTTCNSPVGPGVPARPAVRRAGLPGCRFFFPQSTTLQILSCAVSGLAVAAKPAGTGHGRWLYREAGSYASS
jgi:hypothetical protein